MLLFIALSFHFCGLSLGQHKESVSFWNHGAFLRILILHSALHIGHSLSNKGELWLLLFFSLSLTTDWFHLFYALSSSCNPLSKCNFSSCPENISVLSKCLYVDSMIRFNGQRKKQQKQWEVSKRQAKVIWWPLKASHLHPNYPPTAGSALWHIVLD